MSISVRDAKLTLRDFYRDNYDMPMTPITQADSSLLAPRSSSRQPKRGGLRRGTSLTAEDVDCWSFSR